MKITPLMLKVLRAVEAHEGCGANLIASTLWPDTHRHMARGAGQYCGRLIQRGLLRKRWDYELRGAVSYYLTDLARDILRSER